MFSSSHDPQYLRRNDMKNSPGSNLRHHTNEELKSLSSVECLDLISQTIPCRTMLRKVIVNLDPIVRMRTLTGVLARILRRLRGLQYVEFRLSDDWNTYVATTSHGRYARFGQGFLQLVKRELGHVKSIVINDDETVDGGDSDDVSSWMTFELLKRTKDWVPLSEACGSFRTTACPFQYFGKEAMEQVLEQEHHLRCLNVDPRGDFQDAYGVF